LKEFLKKHKFVDDEQRLLHGKIGWKSKINNSLQRNPSFGETMDKVNFNCKRQC